MSIDDYAELESTTGSKIVSYGNVWWRKTAALFYRPLLPFMIFDPEELRSKLPFHSIYQFGLSDKKKANSYLNLVLYKRQEDYAIEHLSKSKRRNVKKANEEKVEVRQITDVSFLKQEGYFVFKSFISRSGYRFSKERLESPYFERWCESIMKMNTPVVLGVFHQNRLLSFEVSCLVGDTVILKSAINSIEAIEMHAPDVMMHHYRTRLAERTDIKQMFDGFLVSDYGINRFKLGHDATITALPANITLSWLSLKIFKNLPLWKTKSLVGLNEYEIENLIYSRWR